MDGKYGENEREHTNPPFEDVLFKADEEGGYYNIQNDQNG
jgi:hypothetical protein